MTALTTVNVVGPGNNKINLTADFDLHISSYDITTDHKKIVFSAIGIDNLHRLYTMNSDGTNIHPLYENPPASVFGPVWSPDSGRIVFKVYWGTNNEEIYFINSDGSGLEPFKPCHCKVDALSWSTDGTKILINYIGGDSPALLAADVISGVETFITYGNHADWHPHPSKISFQRNRNLFIRDLNTTVESQFTFDGLYTEATSWSYDYSHILFTKTGPPATVWMINEDGSDLTLLVYGIAGKLVNINYPPVALCNNITIPADENCKATIVAADVDDGSYDPDGDDIILSVDNIGPFPLGEHLVNLTVTEDRENGESGTCQAKVTVVDTTSPTIESFTASPEILWPPNHKMILITTTIVVSDNCDPNPTLVLTSITMNEGDETNTYDPNYDSNTGDGNTVNDIQVDENGNIYLRAERRGRGTGRIYTITYTITDASGNSSSASATVTVPHNN